MAGMRASLGVTAAVLIILVVASMALRPGRQQQDTP
jgi:hypothetical protein